jgi:hypothetical protein
MAALAGARIVPGRASLFVRGWTPVAKIVQRLRGNRRIQPMPGRHVVNGGKTL